MPKKILLVDDEQDLLYGLQMQLEANNYDVVTAANGQEAYDLARRENPDIIILDLMLPKIDGFRVCRMLKFDEKYKKIPVIILTARTQAADKKLGSEVGADCYLTKPFEPKVLLDKVEELLNKGE